MKYTSNDQVFPYYLPFGSSASKISFSHCEKLHYKYNNVGWAVLRAQDFPWCSTTIDAVYINDRES